MLSVRDSFVVVLAWLVTAVLVVRKEEAGLADIDGIDVVELKTDGVGVGGLGAIGSGAGGAGFDVAVTPRSLLASDKVLN